MKKLFLLIFISHLSFAQIDGGDYTSKYIEHYEYNYAKDTYLPTNENSGWLDIDWFFDPYGEYYTMFAEGENVRYWYEYEGQREFDGVNCDAYNIEDGRLLLVDYDNNQLIFFGDLDKNNIYQSMSLVSKIEKDD